MRVALVCDWFLPRMGGIELHLRDLAIALRARGIDARIVTTTPGPSEVAGVPVHRIASLLAPGVGVAVSPVGGPIAALLDKEQFDVVHAHASVVSPVAYLGARAGVRGGLPTVITFHSMLHRAAFLIGATDALTGWSRRMVLSAVSSVVARQAATWMQAPNVAILPNGVDTAFWRTERRRTGSGMHFVSAMRITRKKRPEALITAFRDALQFLAFDPGVRLTIAGDGPDRSAMVRLTGELGVSDRVSFSGYLDRTALRALYAEADVFVLPSERESFGIAALEARAAGLPVIAMLESGARDFIRPEVNGILVPERRALGDAMIRIAIDPGLRGYMGGQNASPPLAYDWNAVAAQHEAIYETAAVLRSVADNPRTTYPGNASAAK